MDENRFTQRPVLVKFQKTRGKKEIQKVSRDKKQKVIHKGLGIRKTLDFSITVLEARRPWDNAFKAVEIIVSLEFHTQPNQSQACG